MTLTSLIIRNSKRSIDRDIDLITYSQKQTFLKTWEITYHLTSLPKQMANPQTHKAHTQLFKKVIYNLLFIICEKRLKNRLQVKGLFTG